MHRIGHYEDSGAEDCCSMDRRKYLSTLAAGAAFGAVAVGVAACGGGGGSESKTSTDTTGTAADSIKGRNIEGLDASQDDQVGSVENRKLWGFLRVLPPRFTTIKEATDADLIKEGALQNTIRIPFFNNTNLDISAANPIFGFSLLKIGCPGEFAIAINLTRNDDPTSHPDPEVTRTRNATMDKTLEDDMKYRRHPWNGVNTVECKPATEEHKH